MLIICFIYVNKIPPTVAVCEQAKVSAIRAFTPSCARVPLGCGAITPIPSICTPVDKKFEKTT